GDGPAHGTLTLNPDGSFTYTPDAGFDGVDQFTYRAGDGYDPSALATVTINVTTWVQGQSHATRSTSAVERGAESNPVVIDNPGANLTFTRTYTLPTNQTSATFTIRLDYEGPGGVASITRQVALLPPAGTVQAIATVASQTPEGGQVRVCFNNNSTGAVFESTWNWGDGSPPEVINSSVACHLYNPGQYTVQLTVRNQTGSSTSSTSLDGVNVALPPVASFTVTPGLTIFFGDTVNLDGTGSTNANSYAWEWDTDGTPESTSSTVNNVTLPNIGNNNIRLTVTGFGGSNSQTQTVFVQRRGLTCDISTFTNPLQPGSGTQAYSGTVRTTRQPGRHHRKREWQPGRDQLVDSAAEWRGDHGHGRIDQR
ncbi:MAG: cadherin-like domain-containing protein, partial [Blastochloris sp.]|nr:cadherin-like domain-containing protein [Blastochloris sp.]